MKKRKEKIEKQEVVDENISYRITFKRLNILTLITGVLFFVLAFINIPFAYNPEIDALTFDLVGKPTITILTTFTAYIFLGFIPIIFGVIFILFSLITSRKIIILIYKDGKARYIKKGISNLLLDTQVDFQLEDKIQQIKLGKRHQRFVIWIPVIVLIFLIYVLIDYMNFLDFTFDITFMFYEVELSLKFMLLINILFMIGIIVPYTLFPRKLCRIDTTVEFIQFDYKSIILEEFTKPIVTMSYIKPFKIISSTQRENEEIDGKELEEDKELPDVLKDQISKKDYNHFPFFTLLLNILFMLLIILPQLIENFYLGAFTFRIEYFLTIAAYYFILRTLQNQWFSNQQIELLNNQSDLVITRKNTIFGDSVEYYANFDIIEQDYMPTKPHYLEYILFFFPLWQAIWLIINWISFADYFITQNYYTSIYLIMLVGIFFFTVAEYLFPKSILSITPKSQRETRRKVETFIIYFPSESILMGPPIKEAIKNKRLFAHSLEGIILILVPVIFGIIWFILSTLEIVPALYDTIF